MVLKESLQQQGGMIHSKTLNNIYKNKECLLLFCSSTCHPMCSIRLQNTRQQYLCLESYVILENQCSHANEKAQVSWLEFSSMTRVPKRERKECSYMLWQRTWIVLKWKGRGKRGRWGLSKQKNRINIMLPSDDTLTCHTYAPSITSGEGVLSYSRQFS